MRADRLSLARLVVWVASIALDVIAAGTLWSPVVSTQRRGMVATFLTVHTDLALTLWRFYSPFTAERSAAHLADSLIMRLSPFPVLFAALAVGIVWAHNDAQARYGRCLVRQSVQYCQLAHWGR
jgi:hypothetical protein